MASRQVSLSVNDTPIELDHFVRGLIEYVTGGIIAGLKGTGEIDTLGISIEGDRVTINLNDGVVPTNLFVNKIIKSTIFGMVSSLKGVGEIEKLVISIKR